MVHPRLIAFGTPLQNRLGRLACIGLLCLACCGCLVHQKPELHGASGFPPTNKLDLTFLKVGTTSRQEVLDRLAWMDTGVGDDRFFWGRWKANHPWEVSWVFGMEDSTADDLWDVHNLIIDFDEKSIVGQITHFPNRRMITELSTRLAPDASHSLDLSVPVTIDVAYVHNGEQDREYGSLILSQDAVEFVANDPTVRETVREKYSFKTSPDNLASITMNWLVRGDPGPVRKALETIHFKHETKLGSMMTISIDLPGTATLIKYLSQIQSQRLGGTSRATGNRPGSYDQRPE